MSNRAKLHEPLVDPLSCQALSHLGLDCFRLSTSASSHNHVLEPSAPFSQLGVLAIAPGRTLGSYGSPLNLAWPGLGISCQSEPLILPSLSMLAALLTPLAVLAWTLGIWRLAADPGWTSRFFIASGLLSHWQAWFSVGICARASSRGLNKWLELQAYKAKSVADRSKTSAESRRTPGTCHGSVKNSNRGESARWPKFDSTRSFIETRHCWTRDEDHRETTARDFFSE